MVRCTSCRFLFESPTLGLLPDCPQCGGATVAVQKIEPSEELPPAQATIKIPVIKTRAAAR
jgi:predicted  nucleic acid-binding Zn-ribbon protein